MHGTIYMLTEGCYSCQLLKERLARPASKKIAKLFDVVYVDKFSDLPDHLPKAVPILVPTEDVAPIVNATEIFRYGKRILSLHGNADTP